MRQKIDALRWRLRGENYFYDAETHRRLFSLPLYLRAGTRQGRRRFRVNGGALQRTALFDVHRALGARIVPFGGFEMPVQYQGVIAEHDAVRKHAGLFDLSHMAQFELRGGDVASGPTG